MSIQATNPHQEHVTDIIDFIWHMGVSYRGLNKVTKIYEFPILRCDMAVTIFQTRSGKFWIVTVDAQQGYH